MILFFWNWATDLWDDFKDLHLQLELMSLELRDRKSGSIERRTNMLLFWFFSWDLLTLRKIDQTTTQTTCHVGFSLLSTSSSSTSWLLLSSDNLHTPTLSSRLLLGNPYLTQGSMLPCQRGQGGFLMDSWNNFELFYLIFRLIIIVCVHCDF